MQGDGDSRIPTSDAISEDVRSVGTAQIADSPPPHREIEDVQTSLNQIGIEVTTILFTERQSGNECGYRAILAAAAMSSPDGFMGINEKKSHTFPSADLVYLFNTIIRNCGPEAIPLSNIDIANIVPAVDFLQSQLDFGKGHMRVAALQFKHLRNLHDDCCVIFSEHGRNMNDEQSPFIIKETMRNIAETARKVIPYVKTHSPFSGIICDLSDVANRLEYLNEEFLNAAERFCDAVDAWQKPEWFAGVFTIQQFINYITYSLNLKVAQHGMKSAVVHLHNHWVAISYSLKENTRAF